MNQTIHTIIIDDESSSLEKLREDLSQWPEIKTIATFPSGKSAKKFIIEKQPDLLFLDIEMPEMSGLQLLHEIKNDIENMRIVFYTAHNKYLKDAIRMSAFDYLQKPYLQEELSQIIDRFQTTLPSDRNKIDQSLRLLLKHENKFAVQAITGLMLVKCEDVLYFKYLKEQRCWQMFFVNNTTYKLRTNISAKDLTTLSTSFLQINQNCILNLTYLMSVENKTLKCKLYPPFDETELTASSRYFKKMRDKLDIL